MPGLRPFPLSIVYLTTCSGQLGEENRMDDQEGDTLCVYNGAGTRVVIAWGQPVVMMKACLL